MTRLAAPLGLVLGMGIAAALGPGLAEVIHHGGWNPFDEEGRAIAADGGTAALVASRPEPVPVSARPGDDRLSQGEN
jgi:hypothetical protein